MKKDKRNYQTYFPEVPAGVHQAVVDALASLDEEELPERRKRKRLMQKKGILAAAVLVALLGTTAAATGIFQWDEHLAEKYGNPSQELQDKMAQRGMVTLQGASVENEGLTVTVVQTLQTVRNVCVLLKITSDDPTLADGVFHSINAMTEEGYYLSSQLGMGAVGVGYNSRQEIESLSEDGFVAYQMINIDWSTETEEEIFLDGIVLRVGYYYYEDNGKSKCLKVFWELPISLNTKQTMLMTKSCEVDEEFVLQDVSFRLRRVTVTPLSIELMVEVPEGMTPNEAQDMLYPWLKNYLKWTDLDYPLYALEDLEGNVIEKTPSFKRYSGQVYEGYGNTYPESFSGDAEVLKFDVEFFEIMDVDNIGAVLLNWGDEVIRVELK